MGAAPQETAGLWEDADSATSPGLRQQVKNGLYCTFLFLGNRVCPAEALLTCRRPCTSEYGAAEPQGDLWLSSEDRSPGVGLSGLRGRSCTWDPQAGWTVSGLSPCGRQAGPPTGRCQKEMQCAPALGHTTQTGKFSWQMWKSQKQAIATTLNSNRSDSLSPTLEPDYPREET